MNNTQWVEITAVWFDGKEATSIITVGAMGFDKAVKEVEKQLSKPGRKFQKNQWEKGGRKVVVNNNFDEIIEV